MKTYWFRTTHLSNERLSSIMDKLEAQGEKIGAVTRMCRGMPKYLVRRPTRSGGFIWVAGISDKPEISYFDEHLVEIHLEGV